MVHEPIGYSVKTVCLPFWKGEFKLEFSLDKHRQKLFRNIIIKTLLHNNTEEEAIQIFLWDLAGIEPPVNYGEQMVFRALYRLFYSYNNVTIDSNEKALKALGIPRDKWCHGPKELIKQAKTAYWKQFETIDMHSFIANAADLGLKKKAFMFLSGSKEV